MITKLTKKKHDQLIKAVVPDITAERLPLRAGGTLSAVFTFKIKWVGSGQNNEGQYRIIGQSNDMHSGADYGKSEAALREKDIEAFRTDALSLDDFLADANTSQTYLIQCNVTDNLISQLPDVDADGLKAWESSGNSPKYEYIPQSFFDENGELKKHNVEDVVLKRGDVDIPPEFLIEAPADIIVDEPIMKRVMQYIHNNTPATALVGPTGSGKSLHGRWIAEQLREYGYAAMIVDANGRIGGDRLFDRDDFDNNGTYILEGVLIKFARETADLGLKGIVQIEEYNALPDKTRREFYRVFSNHDRRYEIMSTKEGKVHDIVDFGHIQFLITANPLTEQYITDDLKPLSQAENRRIKSVYLPYPEDPSRLRAIMESIVNQYPLFQTVHPSVNYGNAVKLFQQIHEPDADDESLGVDLGFTPIADCAFWAAINGNTADAWIDSIHDHIITKVDDRVVRQTIAERIQTTMGIELPEEILIQGVA